MRKGKIYLYYGEGKGKTTLAIGQGMRAVSGGLSVVMVQFLDYNNNSEYVTLKRMEPEFRAFRFEKKRESIEKADENEIKNEINLAFNFSKKILETGESEMLILDGIIDAVTSGFIDETELAEVLEKRSSYMDIIITGSKMCPLVADCADYIYTINVEKTPIED